MTPITFLIKKQTRITQRIQDTENKIYELKETIAPKPTVIQTNGFPDKHVISLEFVPQAPEKNWDQPWQDTCEEAALLTVDFYYKNISPNIDNTKSAILTMLDFEKKEGWTKDIDINKMAQIGEKYLGYKYQIISNPSVVQIKEYVAKDIPVIIPASGKTLFLENHHFSNGGPYYHNLVIVGYDDNSKHFITHDVGTQYGKYYPYSYDIVMKSIHDLPDNGNKEDIDSGKRNILVLLK